MGDYRADVLLSDGDEVENVGDAICAERGWQRLVVPPDLPWRPPVIELVEDHGLTARELHAVDGALTA